MEGMEEKERSNPCTPIIQAVTVNKLLTPSLSLKAYWKLQTIEDVQRVQNFSKETAYGGSSIPRVLKFPLSVVVF